MTEQILRVAAYAVCRDADRILLARYVSPDGRQRHWALPGGKVEHGEDPTEAVVREIEEETGYQAAVTALLGITSRTYPMAAAPDAEMHALGVAYQARITGGTLRHETGGSTDLAAWVPAAQVAEQPRAVIIDLALRLERERPADGHVAPIPVGGLLRH